MNIGVIFGGENCEHDISVITGLQLIGNIDEYLYNIYPIYIDKNGSWLTGDNLTDPDVYLGKLNGVKECCLVPNDTYLYIKCGKKYKKYINLDVVILCLHGLRGEDGSVAAVVELSKIPYSSSSICASSVCMDKCVFKSFVKGLGVNVVQSVTITESEYYDTRDNVLTKISELGYPIIIKPSRQGSSIGIEVCSSLDELDDLLKNAFKYDKKLIIEKFVKIKKEVNVAIVNNKDELLVSNTEEPKTDHVILDFDDKYKNRGEGFESIKRIIPAGISKDQDDYIRAVALKVYKELEMFGVVRFDFIISNNDEIFLNEVNTIPGSMANYLFDKDKLGYKGLIDMMIKNALFRKNNSDKMINILNTDLLSSGLNGLKK